MSEHQPALTGAARVIDIHHSAHASEPPPFVSLNDVSEIELLILRRMREVTIGEHGSQAHGSGFDYVGLRDWQAGDRFSSIDWPQSTLTNFSPMIVREYEQPSTATVVTVADASLSTQCGVDGVPVAATVARAIATLGMSAVFFQDLFGLVAFDANLRNFAAVRPQVGRNQVVHCLDAYQYRRGLQEVRHGGSLSTSLGSFLRRTALVPFISDFLFEDPETVLHELSLLSTTHDVFVVLIDAASAFEVPALSSGWIDTVDVETGRTVTMSRNELQRMADRIREWQNQVAQMAADADLDVICFGGDAIAGDLALAEFVAERRLRKVS
jgi:uncharacterized protein (DUF58 family)